ncbi:undecaprenyl-diphosphatase [Herbaspirillum sp. WKF16]|uniref:undecaprenyl-diphosphatase n=1 Tax=Herbaspirillum sp. WKF16 TaxID=3028312 RepID=UPI0023A9A5CC|nr:undecaprenyl-diphosphatase [Herbaspirillum sp. WKF16]WDZ95811.1 undecaprenyl-diphosphatase [Herbaspirillum sp. WKF16]
MELLNFRIFLLLNSSAIYTSSWREHLAVFTAEWLVWALPPMLVYLWLRGDFKLKKAAVGAALSAAIALCVGGLLGWLWPHPRPFMLGMGHLLINHAADASLPSDHLTLWWGIALGLAHSAPTKRIGLLLTATGLAPAWARVFVGVHFPADMLAAFIVALGSAHVVSAYGRPMVTKATVAGVQLQRALLRRYARG